MFIHRAQWDGASVSAPAPTCALLYILAPRKNHSIIDHFYNILYARNFVLRSRADSHVLRTRWVILMILYITHGLHDLCIAEYVILFRMHIHT